MKKSSSVRGEGANKNSHHRENILVLTIDLDGKIIYFNDKLRKIGEYSKNDMIEKNIVSFIPEEHRNDWKKIFKRVKKGEHFDNYKMPIKSAKKKNLTIGWEIFPFKNKEEDIDKIALMGSPLISNPQKEKNKKLKPKSKHNVIKEKIDKIKNKITSRFNQSRTNRDSLKNDSSLDKKNYPNAKSKKRNANIATPFVLNKKEKKTEAKETSLSEIKEKNKKLVEKNLKLEEKLKKLNSVKKTKAENDFFKNFFRDKLSFIIDVLNIDVKKRKLRDIKLESKKRKEELKKIEAELNEDKKTINQDRETLIKWRKKLELLEEEIELRRKYFLNYVKNIREKNIKKNSYPETKKSINKVEGIPINKMDFSDKDAEKILNELSKSAAIIQRGILKKVNSSFTNLIGHKDEELIEKSFFNFIPPDDLSKVEKYYLNRLKGEELPEYNTRLITEDRGEISVRIKVLPVFYNDEIADMCLVKKNKDFLKNKKS